jgi:hypothetical protein
VVSQEWREEKGSLGFGPVAATVLGKNHRSAWFGQELIVFWAPFFYSWFTAIGTEWDLIESNGKQQGVEQLTLATRLGVSSVKSVGKVMKAVESSFKGEASERDVINERGALHQCLDEVISHQVHEQLFADHGRRQTAQQVHSKEGLNLTEMEFHSPASEIELGELGRTETVIIE